MHISPSDPHQLLRELAETTTSAAFTATLDKLDLSQPERISRWLEQNKDLLNKDDVSQLLHIERKLISFSNAKPGDDTICDIERICLALLSPAARTDRMQQIKDVFQNSSEAEKAYIYTLLLPLSQESYSQLLYALPADTTFTTVEHVLSLFQRHHFRE